MSENNLKVFENEEFGTVRALTLDGEPWFVGKDVAAVLGYENPTKAIRDHVDEDDKKMGVQNVTPSIKDSLGRDQYPSLINESGLYSLILSSKLPAAKAFKRWVTSEVLPTIRKTGSYRMNRTVDPPAVPLNALVRLMETQERTMKAMNCDAFEIAAMMKGLMVAYGVPVTRAFAAKVPEQLSLFDFPDKTPALSLPAILPAAEK